MNGLALCCLCLLAPFAVQDEAEEPFLKVGDHLWVGLGMANGYGLRFGQRLTVKKVRVLFMKEARMVFVEHPERLYLRTDFGDDYAFRQDPRQKYAFSEATWSTILAERIEVGMTLEVFLCIRPRSEEIHRQEQPDGPVEQWIYREHPVSLYGNRELNPPTHIYYFQDGVLIAVM